MDGRPTWTDCDEAGDYVVPNVLKTHFGLHNTLMTLSSLKIRNCGALLHLLQVWGL